MTNKASFCFLVKPEFWFHFHSFTCKRLTGILAADEVMGNKPRLNQDVHSHTSHESRVANLYMASGDPSLLQLITGDQDQFS